MGHVIGKDMHPMYAVLPFIVVNNLVSWSVSLSPRVRVLFANECRLPTTAAAYAPFYRPIAEKARNSHLIRLFRERNRDPRTGKLGRRHWRNKLYLEDHFIYGCAALRDVRV